MSVLVWNLKQFDEIFVHNVFICWEHLLLLLWWRLLLLLTDWAWKSAVEPGRGRIWKISRWIWRHHWGCGGRWWSTEECWRRSQSCIVLRAAQQWSCWLWAWRWWWWWWKGGFVKMRWCRWLWSVSLPNFCQFCLFSYLFWVVGTVFHGVCLMPGVITDRTHINIESWTHHPAIRIFQNMRGIHGFWFIVVLAKHTIGGKFFGLLCLFLAGEWFECWGNIFKPARQQFGFWWSSNENNIKLCQLRIFLLGACKPCFDGRPQNRDISVHTY